MGVERPQRIGRLMRGLLAVAAVLSVALAGGATATAATAAAGSAGAHRDGRTFPGTGTVPAGTISTVAGGVGGPAKATKVALFGPCGVSFGAGRVYVADEGAVRTVDPGTDRLDTLAGTGARGLLGDRGPATAASLTGVCGVAVDHSGNLVIADAADNRIRLEALSTGTFYGKAMKGGHIYTVAGTGFRGYSGDGRSATKASLRYPVSVAVDSVGNLVIGDASNERIRVVAARTGTFYGQAMTAGDIYTVAGTGPGPGGACKFSGDGGPATSAQICDAQGIALDAAGNLVFSDSSNNRIRVVAAGTGTFYGQAMTAGDIYTIAGTGTAGFSGDGGPATSAELNMPHGVAVDAAGNVLISDFRNDRVRVVAAGTGTFYGQSMTAGHIYTIAGTGTAGFSGDGGLATSANLDFPSGVALDAAGNVLISDDLNGRVRVVAESAGTFYDRAMGLGHIDTVAGNGRHSFSGDGGAATYAELGGPVGLTVDAAGNLLIADTGNFRIRVSAARTGTFYGQAMTAGNIYTVAGNGKRGFSGDGGPATSAELGPAQGVAVDGAGNLVIADESDNRIRVVAARTGTFYGQTMTAGHIYTVAGNGKAGFSGDGGPATGAKLNDPGGVAVDSAGNLVIADEINNRIRVVAARTGSFYSQPMTAGNIYTVAGTGAQGFSGDGGPATSAEFADPSAVAVDAAGNLVITDFNNDRVRVVAAGTGTFYGQAMTAGDIYTIAGDGGGFAGDGGPATSAKFNGPVDLAIDASGNVAIADYGNQRVRVVAARTGTFYGQAMTAGDIYTVAGNGVAGSGSPPGNGGFSGDRGPATAAELNTPLGVAVNAAGDLLIADDGNNRVRLVTG